MVYKKSFPFKDFNDKPHNTVVHFNLTEREVFKLLPEFKKIFEWRESMKGPERDLDPEEVVEFYTAFEDVLLAAYGIPSDDGLHFRKGSKYDFEESALFNACMVEFISNPEETSKLINGIMPKNLEEIVKNADVNLEKLENSPETEADLRREIAELRAKAITKDVE